LVFIAFLILILDGLSGSELDATKFLHLSRLFSYRRFPKGLVNEKATAIYRSACVAKNGTGVANRQSKGAPEASVILYEGVCRDE